MRIRSIFGFALAWLTLASTSAAAAQITLAWDANTESDLAGYIVEYGPASAPFTSSVDVGNATTWTFANATAGTSYSFHVIAYNTNGEQSVPSDPISATASGTPLPTLTPDRTALRFAIVANAAQTRTRAQTIRLTQSGSGAVTWTASSNAPWLQVSPAAGTGSGAFTVTLVPSAAPAANASSTIAIAATGTANTIAPIAIALNVLQPSAVQPPFGVVDTPVDNTAGVTGSMAMTGWALDDVDVARVRIMRDPVAGETPGQLVYIGDATVVEDARPDVDSLYAAYPESYRSGWGYLLLSNMLPSLGNGTFRLSAYAEDADGHSTLLGLRTVTCANAGATQPFGAIDTPAPGETVSGGIYTSFGWVLSPGLARADVPGGGTVTVLIDGAAAGSPAGWAARSDLSALFPASLYSGVGSALAVFAFDTTTLANGMHTMAWVVTDNTGSTQGVGSRYFRVFNGAGAGLQAAAVSGSNSRLSLANEVAAARVDTRPIDGRRGFDLDVAFRAYQPDVNGSVTVHAEELDRIELKTNGATEGYLRVGADLRPLPVGSRLNRATGEFVWQPGVGFVGAYDLTFVHRSGSWMSREDVRVVLNPKGSNRVGPQVIVDLPAKAGSYEIAGWAADLDSQAGTGIDTIHVWAYPRTPDGGHGQPIFVGVAAYGGARPDVAAIFGDRFRDSGYGLVVQDLAPGSYDLALFAWSTARNAFLPATVVPIEIK